MIPVLYAKIITTEDKASELIDFFSEIFEPDAFAGSAFEFVDDNSIPSSFPRPMRQKQEDAIQKEEKNGILLPNSDCDWLVELYFGEGIEEAEIHELILENFGEDVSKTLKFDVIEAKDWIKTSLEGLHSISVGRFFVHGEHDRGSVPVNRIGIEIAAALAFGTGHHGTTKGCLQLLDFFLKYKKPNRIVDIGTGTGVLAFAAAKTLKTKIMAGDMDYDSVIIARENARLNKVAGFVRLVHSRGLKHPDLRNNGSYDLVFANILARPLKALAYDIAKYTSKGGILILSGLLPVDVISITAKYRNFGFIIVKKIHIEGWVSLLLQRKI